MDNLNTETFTQPRFDITTCPTEVCVCGNKIWIAGNVLKKVSALMSPTGKDQLVPIPIFVCSKCGEVASTFKNDPMMDKIMGNTEF